LLDVLQKRLQIITPKGVVLVGAEHKKHKTSLLRFIFSKLGLNVLVSVPDPLKMSGGDYVPVGEDLCFMGTGTCTDEAAVRYLLQKKRNVFGHSRVAVVRDLYDRSHERPHLDSVFKVISANCILILESVLGKGNLRRRLVDEYVTVGSRYECSRMGVELGEYVTEMGFHVIELPEHLYKDGLGVVNVGQGHLLVIRSLRAPWRR